MLRAIIIDDEYNGVRSLELLIQKFVPDVKVVASTTNPVEGIELVNNYRPEIVFLDINMPVLDGFQFLDNLEFRNFNLIFCTAYREHGLKALKNNALDYLLKPVSIEDLRQSIARVKEYQDRSTLSESVVQLLRSLTTQFNQKINFPTRNSIELIPANLVLYIEANSNTTKVLLKDGTHLNVLRALKEYESILCTEQSRFMRVHNSFIINIDGVLRFSKEDGASVTMLNKTQIPVSKLKKEELLKCLNNAVADS